MTEAEGSRATPGQLILFVALLLSVATVSAAFAAYDVFLNHESFYTVTVLTTLIWVSLFLLTIALVTVWSILGVWWFFRGRPA